MDGALPQVFAFGDVADTGGPKMARAAYFQSEIIVQNILSLIKGEQILKEYRPNVAFEGSIKLTLGKVGLQAPFFPEGPCSHDIESLCTVYARRK